MSIRLLADYLYSIHDIDFLDVANRGFRWLCWSKETSKNNLNLYNH